MTGDERKVISAAMNFYHRQPKDLAQWFDDHGVFLYDLLRRIDKACDGLTKARKRAKERTG